MDAKLYKLFIPIDAVHRHLGEEIWELFIPDAGIIVNNKYGCFKSKELRALSADSIIDVKLDYSFVVLCNKKANINEKINNKIDDVFAELKRLNTSPHTS